jgi:hypothetical protein
MSELSSYKQVNEQLSDGANSALIAEAIKNNHLLRAAYEIESIVLVSEIEIKNPIATTEDNVEETSKPLANEAEIEEEDPAQLVEYNTITGADHFGLSIDQPGEIYLDDYKSSADRDREIIIRSRDDDGKTNTLLILGNRIYDVEDSIKHGKPCGIILENGDDMPNPIVGQRYDADLPNARGKVEEVTIKVKGNDKIAINQLPIKVVDNPYEEDSSPFEQIRTMLDNLNSKVGETKADTSNSESIELETDEEAIREIISNPIFTSPTQHKTRIKQAMELASSKFQSTKEKSKSRRLRSAAVAAIAIVGAAVSLAVIEDGSSNNKHVAKPFHARRVASEQDKVSEWVQEEGQLENKLDKGTKLPKGNRQGKLPTITINLPSKSSSSTSSSNHTKAQTRVSYHSTPETSSAHNHKNRGSNLSKIPGIIPKVS